MTTHWNALTLLVKPVVSPQRPLSLGPHSNQCASPSPEP